MSTYTYTFLAKDLMSSKLSKISKTGTSSFQSISEKNNRFRNGLKRTETQLDRTKRSVSSLDGIIKKLGIGFGIFEAVRTAGTIINLGADMEQTRISFETMLGSADKANKVLNDLNGFSNATPFKNKEVIAAGRNLLAFGISNEKLLPSLKKIGDVSAGLKIPFGELSEIYGKIKVQNTVYSEDLNQLAGRGIPIFTELSKVMGVAPEQIKKLASEGKITFPFIEQAFTNMTSEGGAFFNLMDKQSKSFGGLWSTLTGKIQAGATKLGEKSLPFLSKLTAKAISFVDAFPAAYERFKKIAQPLFQTLQNLFGVVSNFFSKIFKGAGSMSFFKGILENVVHVSNFFANGLITIVKILTPFAPLIKTLAIAYGIWTAAQWAINVAMSANPIGLIILGIVALISTITYAYQKVGWFRGGIMAIWETIKGFGNAIKDYVINRVISLLKGITGLALAVKQFFSKDWKNAFETGKKATADLLGLNAKDKFIDDMKKVGKKAGTAYNIGVNEAKANKLTGASFIKGLSGGKVAAMATENDTNTGENPAGPPKGLGTGIDSITGGGSKQTNINITFDKLVENFTVQSQTVQQGMMSAEDELKKMLLRVLNSTNQMQTSLT